MPSSILNPGDPIFNGTSGPDSFSAPAGNSGINGFGGIDTVTFSFNLVDAAVSYHDNVVWIDTATSHTELTGIQTYIFNDGTVSEKDGNALVADLFYYSRYHDIWNAHIEADTHYALYGWHEGRDPSAFFDTNLYLSLNQDVLASGVNPLVQFDTVGWTQNRQPSAAFNVQKYLAAYPDVAAAHVDPLEHFLNFGIDEGRVPFPVNTIANSIGFDALYYLQTYADVKAAHVDPYQHFLNYGWHEGRNPNKYFDTLGYLATYTDVAAAGVNPLIHFDSNGWHEGRIPSPGFDAAQYLAVYTDVAAAGVDPLAHFLKYGIDEGRVAFAKPIFDTNGAANTVLEGAAAGTNSGLSVSWGGWISPNLWFSLSSDTSGGGFTINTLTGAVTVADSTKLDFETSGASHSYTIVVVAHDNSLSSSQSFTINIGDVTPTTPIDGNAAANTVVEGAANGSTVGVTLFSDEPNGPPVVYQLTDNAGGRFAVDSSTGVVTVANAALLDFESGAHSFVITGRTQVGAVFTPTQNFTINLTNAPPSPISDSNAANETVNEGAAVNTLVGIDADSTDPLGPAVIWSITSDSSGGGFKIDANGVVSVADASKIDYEGAPGVGHSYSIIVQASDGVGGTTSRNFGIVVNNVNPTTPVEVADGTPGGSVTEGAAADTLVGVQASATDINGPPVSWSIVGDTSGGGFKIDANGVVSVANAALINYETATHSYDVTVQASDGFGTSSQTFNILVANVAPATPTEVADGTAGGSVLEGAAANTLVGITASSSDINGPAVIWSITADSSTGGFKIDSNGVVSVNDATKINYETAPGAGRSYDITIQASDGFNNSSQSFNILVGNVNPTTPTDGVGPTGGTVAEGAPTGTLVGIDADSLDPNGPPVTWSILSGSASGGFQIDAGTGVVSVLNGALLNYENAPSIGGPLVGHTILVQASDGQGGTNTQTFTIELTNEAPAPPTDTDPVGDGAGTIKGIATFDATAGTLVGIHAQSAGDPAGGTVTYELAAGSSTFFQINAGTGEVSVSAAGVGNLVAGTDYDISVVAKDATGLGSGTSTATPFKVHVQGLAPGAPSDGDGGLGNNQVLEGATGIPGNFAGSTYTGLDADSSTAGVTFSLSADSSGGGFQINSADGKIYVANGALIDFESAPGNKYSVTVVASDGSLTSSSSFDINVLDVAPTQPIDGDASNGVLANAVQGRIAFNAANGANVGITVFSTDVNGATLSYELTNNQGDRFDISSSTGVVTLKALHPALIAGETFTITARASDGTANSTTRDFVIEVVANQPVIDLDLNNNNAAGINYATTFTEGDPAVAIADTDVTITEAGFTNLASATVTLTNAQLGDVLAVGALPGGISSSIVSGGGIITVTLTGSATFANYQTALQAITFSNTLDTPNTVVPRTVTVTVNDGTNPSSNAATTTITVLASNDAPSLTPLAPGAAAGYTENAAPSALLSTGDVTDADNPANFSGGGFTVAVTAPQTGDQIVVLASSGFTVSGTSLIFGGNTIGDIAFVTGTGVVAASATVTNLTANAIPTVVDALVKAFGFQSSSENPTAGSRTIQFTFDDGGHTGTGLGLSNVVSQTVNVTAVNDNPAIGNLNGDAASFTEGGSAVLLDLGANATVIDVDSANFATGTLTIAITANGEAGEDVLGIQNQGIGPGQIGVSGSDVTFENVVIGTFTGGTGGANLVVTFDPDATPVAVQALLHALTYDNTENTTASTATRAISVTLTDGGGGTTSVNTTVAVNESATAGLTGQLWYVTRNGDPVAPSDNWVGHLNSDGTAITPTQDTTTINEQDIAVETAAGLYFVVTDIGTVEARHTSDGTLAGSLDLSSTFLTVDGLAVDPIHHTLFVGVTGAGATDTGIRKLTYTTAGALTDTTQFLLTDNSLTIGAYLHGIDFTIDLASHLLYYVDSDPTTTANGVYVVDYIAAGVVATDIATATQITDPAQFPADPSSTTPPYLGAIEAVAVNVADGLVYFLTGAAGATGANALWYVPIAGGTAIQITALPAPISGNTLTGESVYTGLTFDPVSRDLYISNQNSAGTADGILQGDLSADGKSITSFIHTYSLSQLTGQASPDQTTVPGPTTFDILPTLTVAAGPVPAAENAATTLDNSLTLTDPEGYLAGATITVTGGADGGDTLLYTLTGSITSALGAVNTNGVVTLTFSGYDTFANYQSVLRSVQFQSGDNPSDFGGGSTTRTVTWHADDGAAGNPFSTGNTETSTVNITASNDAPTVDLNGAPLGIDYSTTYTYGAAGIPVASATTTVIDPDTATIATATVTLTNAQAGDVLAIGGALPGGISAAVNTGTPGVITVTLTGPASPTAFATALQQVVFSNGDFAAFNDTNRTVTVVVSDGTTPSAAATTTIDVSNQAAPVANADSFTALEAGGLNNAIAGNSPSGNVITGTGSATAVADTDADGPVSALFVSAVDAVTAGGTVVGTVGTAMSGKYGSLTVNSNGSYSYSLDNNNAAVQALIGAATLQDVFHYTIKDASGAASSSAAITITISGADDFAQAFADVGSLSEDAVGATTFNVRANDTLDPDATATNAVTQNGVVTAVGNGAASGLGIDPTDVSVVFNANNIDVTLTGPDIQKLRVGDTATITVPYRLTGNAGQTSDTTLTITVNGANDLPDAKDDTGTMSEDAAATSFAVVAAGAAGLVADTLDVDRTAPNNITIGTITASTAGSAAAFITGADVSVALTGAAPTQSIQLTLGSDFQRLAAGEPATITVAYTLFGDGTDTDTANLTVTVNGVNDAPVVDLLSTAGLQTTGITSTFTENGPVPPSVPVNVLPQVTLSDIDGTTLTGATVTLTNAQVGVDILTLQGEGAATSGTLANGIGYAITSSNTVVTFSNLDSISDYQDALRLIQFNNASDNPTQTDRTFTVQINDGAATNAATTATLDFVAVNDAPVNTTPNNLNPMSDTDFFFTAGNTVSVADADAGAGLIRTTLGASHGDLSVSLAGGATVFSGTNGTHTFVLQGTVTQINLALATLKYNSDAGYTGLDSLTVQTSDQGNSPAPTQSDNDNAITLGVIPKVWIIDNSVAGSGGDGSAGNPFRSIAEFNAATTGASANEYVLLKTGTGTYAVTDGIHLKDGMELVGGGDGLSFVNPIAGQPAIVFNPTGGARPTIQVSTGVGDDTGIDLASDNKVHGLNVATVDGTAIGIDDGVANNSVGTLQVSNMQITGAGKAIDIDHGGALTVTLDKLTSTGSSSEGIDLGGNVTGTFTVNNNTSAISGAAGTDFNISTNGLLNVTYNGGITQASNAALVSISGGHTGTVTFQNGTLSATNGTGLQFDNADGTYHFNGTNTLGGGNAGIDILNGSSGTFNFQAVGGAANTTITNPTGTAFNLLDSNANVTYSGSITEGGAGSAVFIDNHDSGTITFQNGSITSNGGGGSGITVQNNGAGTVNFNSATIALTTGATNGVTLASNTGSAINFTMANGGNGLDISTTTGTGFSATGGGTVVVTDPTDSANSINSGSGTALNVVSTTIGASNLNFHDISHNGAGVGIVLNNTGATGSLIVTGDASAVVNGTNNSGGIIQNTGGTAAGILLISTLGPSFTNMHVLNTGGSGVTGTDVTNFTFKNGKIDGSGTGGGNQTSNIGFNTQSAGTENNIDGNVTITGNVLTNALWHGVSLFNFAGTISDANISNNTLTSGLTTGAGGTSFGSGIQLVAFGSATTVASVTKAELNNNTITNFPGGVLMALQGGTVNNAGPIGTYGTPGSATNDIEVMNNILNGGGSSVKPNQLILAAINGKGVGNFNIQNNGTVADPISGAAGNMIDVSAGGNVTVQLTASGNRIDAAGQTVGGTSGIAAGVGSFDVTGPVTLGDSTLYATIQNNNIVNSTGSGIRLNVNNGTPELNAIVTGNTVGAPSSATYGIQVVEGPTGTKVTNLQIQNNTSTGGTGGGNTFAGIGLRKQGTTVGEFNIVGMSPSPGNNVQMETAISALNPGSAPGSFDSDGAAPFARVVSISSTSNNWTSIASVPQPPALPQLAAYGQGPGDTGVLTAGALAPIVAHAILLWAHAGATPEQIALLNATPVSIVDLPNSGYLGNTTSGGIQIDVNGGGWGWFVDPTPASNAEFGIAASSTELVAASGDASGHIDLLTTVAHEFGHLLGLPDIYNGSGGVMDLFLDAGTRMLPSAADVAQASELTAAFNIANAAESALPASAAAPDGTPVVVGLASNDTLYAGIGGTVLVGGGGADTFVFDQAALNSPVPVTHIADYSAAQGDSFDFSGLQIADAANVRVVEDASDAFAMLQVDIGTAGPVMRGAAPASHWVSVAQVDGIHAGDAIDVWLNPAQVAHLHAGLLG